MAPKRYFPIRQMKGFNVCPGCGDGNEGRETMVTGVLQCTGCKGYVGECYRGEALTLVELDEPIATVQHGSVTRYFDFTWIDTKERVRGLFDRGTHLVYRMETL